MTSKLVIYTRKDCLYCNVLKYHLAQENVTDFIEMPATGAAPVVEYDGEVVFEGLPALTELQEFTNKIKNE